MDRVELNNGVQMPLLGFGVFQITDQEVCKESVKAALNTGYRMIDTAACYGNERAVSDTTDGMGTFCRGAKWNLSESAVDGDWKSIWKISRTGNITMDATE